ncbi:unnamed protein product [Calicophoron daubneyi]|uniref:Nucleolar MIF4G domain-containing protein 1 n=1 Tax=Calicophoron daubneyi TaxID=300641 RepID=A0AAV2SWJ1_CALDB
MRLTHILCSLDVMKVKKRTEYYNKLRREDLLEDNEEEDRIIKRLEKKLGMRNRSKEKSKRPLWIEQYGFDYLLDFEEELRSNKTEVSPLDTLAKLPRKKKKKTQDIYGQKIQETTEEQQICSVTAEEGVPTHEDMSGGSPSKSKLSVPLSEGSERTPNLRRSIRSWLNRLSESTMPRVITELTNIFHGNPRALVCSLLVEEACILLESTPVSNLSGGGWLQQDLAVCLACIHVNLHTKLEHDNLICCLCKRLVDQLLSKDKTVGVNESSLGSFAVFLCYLNRFEVLSHSLVFDIMRELLNQNGLERLKAVHLMCIANGIYLRKANLVSSQELIKTATGMLTECSRDQVDRICELEGIIRRLSEKHSKEECVSRSVHLRKMMKIWTSASLPQDFCLSMGLEDLRSSDSVGRLWVVGPAVSAPNPPASMAASTELSPEMEAAATRLGLRTAPKRHLFSVLTSTPGGPDSTASALLKACSQTPFGGGTSASSAREREAVHIIMHCLMAEEPYNRFYPRVLGGLLNCHRRFSMMIKCAFWDVLKKSDLSVNAKANAGRALGLLSVVYDFPLTVLKNFDFGDASEGNTMFLRCALIEMCTTDYQKALTKVQQLSCYTRLSGNCCIFIRKHFSNEEDANIRASLLRLASDMRDL